MTFFNSPVNAKEYIKLWRCDQCRGLLFHEYAHRVCDQAEGLYATCLYWLCGRVTNDTGAVSGILNACTQNHIQLDERMQFTRPANNPSFSYAMVEEVVKDMAYIPDAIICEDDDVAKNVSLALLQRDSKAVKRW